MQHLRTVPGTSELTRNNGLLGGMDGERCPPHPGLSPGVAGVKCLETTWLKQNSEVSISLQTWSLQWMKFMGAMWPKGFSQEKGA